MASRITLPKVEFDDDDDRHPNTWTAREIFVITVALTTNQPSLYGGNIDNDAVGFTVTM